MAIIAQQLVSVGLNLKKSSMFTECGSTQSSTFSEDNAIERQESPAPVCHLFASEGPISAVPDPDSAEAESEPADPESERASTSKEPKPAGKNSATGNSTPLFTLCS